MKRDWPLREFGKIAEFKNGLNYSARDRGNRIKIIGVSDFQDNFRISHQNLEQVEIEGAVPDGFLLKDLDLVFVRSNGSKALVGRCLLIGNVTEPVTHSGFTIRARVNTRDVDPEFVGYYFQTSLARRAIATAGGGTNISNLSQDLLSAIPVPVPRLDEQLRITAIIGAWDKGIRATELVLAAKIARKRGLMQQLLTGKTRFKEFKGERWIRVRLGELLQEVERYVEFNDQHSYKLASVRRRSEGLFFREELRGSEIKTKVMKSIRAGDFLLSKMQVVHGAWALVAPEFDGMYVSDSYIALLPRDPHRLKAEFFNYLSQTRYLRHLAYLACHGVHIEKMTFHLDDFLHEKISIPASVEEQMQIVEVLSGCDREIDLLEKQLAALKEQKRGLMQKLLTGEIRVKVKEEK